MSVTYQHLDVAQTGVQGLVLNLHVAIRSMQVEVVDVSVTGKKDCQHSFAQVEASSSVGYSQCVLL